MAGQSKKSKKMGRNSRKPAFQRYWAEDRLRKRKIRNLMKHNHLDRFTAGEVWDKCLPCPKMGPIASKVAPKSPATS